MVRIGDDELLKIPPVLVMVLAIIFIMNFIVIYTALTIDQGGFHSNAMFKLFLMDAENNLPTWFSTLMLILASALLFFCYKNQGSDGNKKYWLFLSIIFLVLSLDEAGSVHEVFIYPLRMALELDGYFYFSWIVLAIPIAGILGIIFIPFLKSIPKRTAFTFTGAGLIYISGTIGMEMIGGKIISDSGQVNLEYFVVVTIEETLEMTGIIIFIHGLIQYLTNNTSESIGGTDQK